MTETNPYSGYMHGSILSSNPLDLVVALYEGAIDASVMARNCLSTGDIPGRTKAIKKIITILTELNCSLNDEKGGAISLNLRRLYVYMQGRVTQAHFKQDAAPLKEIEKLFSTLLEGWKGASASYHAPATPWQADTLLPVGMSHTLVLEEEHGYATANSSYGDYVGNW